MKTLTAVGTAALLAAAMVAAWSPLRAQETSLQDGPYLVHADDGSVTAKWVADGVVEEKRFAADEPIRLPSFAALLGEAFVVAPHEPDPAVHEMPERVLALSDVEGRYDAMVRFLRASEVIDEDGSWAFGKGHLVCVGDMVDRGTQVTETLWLMLRLAREAQAAGGRVHHVLGNHEAMLMGGDTRYVAPKYRAVAELLGVPVEGLVGAETELGRWLRTRNSIVRLGDWVFVHAGISADVAAPDVDLDAVNAQVRSVLGVNPRRIEDREAAALVWGRRGPLWYRGYFEEHARDFGPVPSVRTTDRILANVGGKRIVVGHTKVRRVTPMLGGRVVAIDIPWTDPDRVRALLITKDTVDVVDIRGDKTPLVLPDLE